MYLFFSFSFKIADPTGRYPRGSPLVGGASNMLYLIWTIFGGFILHFLLSNYLTVFLRPHYEKPVDTAADLINRGITPFLYPGANGYIPRMYNSSNPYWQELSQKLYIASDFEEYFEMNDGVIAEDSDGSTATIGTVPFTQTDNEYTKWYRGTELIKIGLQPYINHLTNKKWPLQKVLT